MASSLRTVKTRKGFTATPQTQRSRPEEIKNAAGGYTFAVSDMERVKRFLILGAETTYYTPGAKLAKENAETIVRVASTPEGSKALVDEIVAISTAGRAAKQDAGLFALAIAASTGDAASKQYALSKLSAVARTGTTLFQFVSFTLQFRGWGRALKRAVADWYLSKETDKAAFQIVKYRSREKWTHRDLFRVSHPETSDPEFQGLGEWVLRGDTANVPQIVEGFIKAQAPDADVPALIREYGLTWEMVPTSTLNDRKTWDALLDSNSLPLGALLRQLPRLTNLEMLAPLKKDSRLGEIVARLTSEEEIKRSRIHPIAILRAMKVYSAGQGTSSRWTPVRQITEALDKAFYLAFRNVVPTGKKYLIGLDVSGSMGSPISNVTDGGYNRYEYGTPGELSAREATSALALVLASTEPETHVIGFTGGSTGSAWGQKAPAAGNGRFARSVTDLSSVVSPSRRLDDVIRGINGLPFGTTDCSLPMLYALEQGLRPDVFVVMTDNETYAGSMKPHEALAKYRRETGIDAKLIVLATTASSNTITDPNDKNSLDIGGFDTAVPEVISAFSKGEF